MDKLITKIQKAERILLSTHRQCDGDGLGAELAFYFALKKMGKQVEVINVDLTPKKYHFLKPELFIRSFDQNPHLEGSYDLCLIFDTNDERLIAPLFESLQKSCQEIAFIDHHPILLKGPQPSKASWIDVSASSTGELAYRLIKALGVAMDLDIARCLYTSIVFDTQLFRFIRNSPNSHRIAAELLEFPVQADLIHKSLFGNQSVQKMAFLAKTLGQIEYFCEGRLAIIKLRDEDLFHYNLETDDSRDVIDMLMNIETLEAAALFREDSPGQYKLSMRSKGQVEVLSVAENLGGGGHLFAAGSFVVGDFDEIKDQVVLELTVKLGPPKKTAS